MTRILLASALALLAAPALAQDSPAAAQPFEHAATGSIVMFRTGSILGAAVACPIRYEGREIVELGRGTRAEWRVAPGRYILTNRTASVEINVAAGETRYVRCQIKTGFFTGRADLQIVDRASLEDAGELESRDISAP